MTKTKQTIEKNTMGFITPKDKAKKLVLAFFCEKFKNVSSIEEAKMILIDGVEESKKDALICWNEIKDDRYSINEYAMTGEDHLYWNCVKKEIENI